MRRKVFLPGLLAVLFLWPSCRGKAEEDVILETMDNLVRPAEQKNLDAIMSCFAEDFRDFEGRDKNGLRSFLASYFEGRTGIVVHKLSVRIADFNGSRATVEMEAALSSGGAEALRRLVRISPDIYRIRIDLGREEGRWLVRYAEWSFVGLDGLLPESLVELKKIFPRLWSDQ